MEERRTSPRQRTLKGGTVSFDHGGGLECIVRNLSDAGACLEFERPPAMPDKFTLIIKPEYLKRDCVLIWRSKNRVGVRFA